MPKIFISIFAKFPVFRFVVLDPSAFSFDYKTICQYNIQKHREKREQDIKNLTFVQERALTSYNRYKHEVLSDDGSR